MSFLLAMGLFSSVFATDANIRGYYMGTCNHWSLVQSNYQQAWGCNILPQTVVVPDGQDVGNSFRDANAKIAELEKRIQALEAASKP